MLAACRAAGAAAWYVPDDFLVLGPNIIDNGDFSQGNAGWNPVAATQTVSGGEATLTATSTSSPQIYRSFPTTPGRSYILSFDAKIISAPDVRLYSGGILAISTSASWTSMRGVISATASTANIVCLMGASAAGQQAAFRNIDVREILSAKDWQDSAGTLPSYLGGTVGLAQDSAIQIGAETLIDTEFNDPSKWFLNQPTSGSVTISSGAVTVTSLDGSFASAYALAQNQVTPIVVGRSYLIEFEVTAASGGGVRIDCGGFVGTPRTYPGIYRQYFTATSNGAPFVSRGSAVACSGTVTRLYVKEITGYNVAQATAGNRPLITRIPRKLGPELLVNAFISGTNATNTGSASGNSFTINQVDTSSIVGATLSMSVAPTAGKSYYVTSTPSGLSGSGFKVDNSAWTPAPVQATAGFVITATSTPSSAIYVYRNSAPAAGAFSNVSVREVLEWSYALTFDGSNDLLATTASVIGPTLTQPYTMIAWGRTSKSDGTAQRIVGDTARWLAINSVGGLSVTNQAATTVSSTETVAVGALFVAEVVWDGSVMKIWKDGALETTSPCGAPTGVTPSATNIGINGTLSNYFKGDLGGCVVCPAVMTDAQRLAVRKFAAAQMGMTL